MKYVTCKFWPEDSRAYTYLAGDHALAIGDEVLVPAGRGDGDKRVIVSGFTDEEPEFACKAVIGLAPPREISVTEADIGRKVVYRGYAGEIEEGFITSLNDSFVFVRYGTSSTSQATRRDQLEFIA